MKGKTAEPARLVAPGPSDRPTLDVIDPYLWLRKPRCEHTLPIASGVYALFLREGCSLADLVPVAGGLVYIGRGSSLAKRCHFSGRTEGHSPRRSLAALLWQQLELEPVLAANGNCKLTKTSEKRLDSWMHENLLMAFYTCDDCKMVEDVLIKRHQPPLNLTKSFLTPQHRAVGQLRKAMLSYAIGGL